MKAAMTRKEAIAKCHGIAHPEALVQALEALGLIEFEHESEVVELYVGFNPYKGEGVVRLERWPEGIVLWVSGQIKWRSWS